MWKVHLIWFNEKNRRKIFLQHLKERKVRKYASTELLEINKPHSEKLSCWLRPKKTHSIVLFSCLSSLCVCVCVCPASVWRGGIYVKSSSHHWTHNMVSSVWGVTSSVFTVAPARGAQATFSLCAHSSRIQVTARRVLKRTSGSQRNLLDISTQSMEQRRGGVHRWEQHLHVWTTASPQRRQSAFHWVEKKKEK